MAYVPVDSSFSSAAPLLYFLDEVGLELLIVLLSPINFLTLGFWGVRRNDR